MAENRGYGSFQEGSQAWPPTGQNGEPRYQPPADFYSSSSWAETPYIPAQIFKQAEARVAAQRRFFKHLFLYLGIVAAVWIIGISQTLAHYSEFTTTNERMVGLFVPLFITVIGGIRVAYSYFSAYIWEKKTHQERVMKEVQRLVL